MRITPERVMTAVCVAAIAGMVLTVAVTLYNEPEYIPFPHAAARPPSPSGESGGSPEPVAAAPRAGREELRKGQINHMINILRTSAIRGDDVTKRAMTIGIQRHGEIARPPLQAALARESNPNAAAAIEQVLESLGAP